MSKRKKILIASGGTGGHLFPAQALGRDLLDKSLDVFFAGKGLSENRCFHKELFCFRDIEGSSLSFKNLSSFCSSILKILKGVKQGLKLLKEFDPDLVVGFGSFFSFPLIMAALLKRVPFVLFEPNSEPGKVNRLFSRWALVSAIQFPEAAERLSGRSIEVNVPIWTKEDKVLTDKEARAYFSLDPDRFTFLVFGGSQGASAINKLFCEAMESLKGKKEFQVLHIAGNSDRAEEVRRLYVRLGITSCVKEFEDKMNLAWRAASLVVCRAGASSLAEQLAFEVPGILIPYPFASDNHQEKNAEIMQTQVGGAINIPQSETNAKDLIFTIEDLLTSDKLNRMKTALLNFKKRKNRSELSELILGILGK